MIPKGSPIICELIVFLTCRDFKSEDGLAEIPLNVTVQGDVLIAIYHARSTLGGRLQAKVPTDNQGKTLPLACNTIRL